MRKFFCITCLFILIHSQVQAKSAWNCFFTGVGEWAVPGLGYAITQQWDKTAIFGGLKWYSSFQYLDAASSDFYQEDADDIYQFRDAEDSESGKNEVQIYMNKETWDVNFHRGIYSNLTLISFWDLYEHSCEKDPKGEVYQYSAAPFAFNKFYKKWQFWLPIGIALSSYANFEDNNQVDWYLYRGLTKSQIQRESFPLYYSVGVAEELFFRGVIQDAFFNYYKKNYSAAVARHLGVFSASLVFGAAHSGAGFSANSGFAFLYGVYLGYVYQPSTKEFDLTTAIAIHSWWDIIVAYAIINNANFHDEEGNAPPLPILQFNFNF